MRVSTISPIVLLASVLLSMTGLSAASAAHAAAPLRVETLIRMIENAKVKTVDQAVALLPAEYKTRYTLGYRSLGLQMSSEDEPRAVLYGDTAELVIAFSGDLYRNGEGSLEMLQYDDTTASFELFSLDFPLKKDSKGRIVRPERNPELCLNCHNNNARPIFGIAPQWQGFYGSDHDRITADEKFGFQRYLETKAVSKRYAELAPVPADANRNLTVRLFELLSRHNIKLVREAPLHARYRDLLLFSLKKCDAKRSLESQLGPTSYAALKRGVTRDWWVETGYVPLSLDTWMWPVNVLDGLYHLPDHEIALESKGTPCMETNMSCGARKIDEKSSMHDRLATLVENDFGRPVSCGELVESLRRTWH